MPAPCVTTLPEKICNDCTPAESGRIRACGLGKKGSYDRMSLIDIQDPAVWAQEVVDGNVWIIKKVTGSYDGGTATTKPGYGSDSVITSGIVHTATFKVQWSCEDYDFYNALIKVKGLELYFASELHLQYSLTTANFFVKAMIEDTLESTREYEITATWSVFNMPICIDLPPIVFDDDCEGFQAVIDAL